MVSAPLISFLPPGHSSSPSFLTPAPVILHCLNIIRAPAPASKLPKLGLLSFPGPAHAHRLTSEPKFPGPGLGPLKSPHRRPSTFSQSEAVRECYANDLRVPASEEPRPSPLLRVLFHPSRAELAAASLATGLAANFSPTRDRKNKMKK